MIRLWERNQGSDACLHQPMVRVRVIATSNMSRNEKDYFSCNNLLPRCHSHYPIFLLENWDQSTPIISNFSKYRAVSYWHLNIKTECCNQHHDRFLKHPTCLWYTFLIWGLNSNMSRVMKNYSMIHIFI